MLRWARRIGTGLVMFVAIAAGGMWWQGIPLHAVRREPPRGIDQLAAAVGSRVGDLAAPAADGSTWRLSAALAHGPVVLVFYRGHW